MRAPALPVFAAFFCAGAVPATDPSSTGAAVSAAAVNDDPWIAWLSLAATLVFFMQAEIPEQPARESL